jgi:hypothetical protein
MDFDGGNGCGHRNANPDGYRNRYSYAHGYRDSDSCAHAVTFANPDAHRNRHGYASGNRHSCTHTVTFANPDGHRNRHGYANGYRHGYANGYRHSHSCAHTVTFANPDSHRNRHGYVNGYRYSYANGYRDSHSCTHTDSHTTGDAVLYQCGGNHDPGFGSGDAVSVGDQRERDGRQREQGDGDAAEFDSYVSGGHRRVAGGAWGAEGAGHFGRGRVDRSKQRNVYLIGRGRDGGDSDGADRCRDLQTGQLC